MDIETTYRVDGGERWEHESGAYVEIVRDDDCPHPLEDQEGVYIAFREGARYIGTAPDYPAYPTVECKHCEGTGEQVATGGEPYTVCPHCEYGEVDADAEAYFRAERGALGVASVWLRDGTEAVVYVTADDIADPQKAAEAFAAEYGQWAEGDCWGIESGGPGIEGDSCWGFVGSEHAEQHARDEFLAPAIEAVAAERAERAYWEDRGVATVAR